MKQTCICSNMVLVVALAGILTSFLHSFEHYYCGLERVTISCEMKCHDQNWSPG